MSSRLPVRLRLTLWYSALLAGALVLFAASVYLVVNRSLTSNLDASLHERINQLVPLVDVSNHRPHLLANGEDPDAPYIPAVLLTPSRQPVGTQPPGPLRSWLRSGHAPQARGFTITTLGNLRIGTAPVEINNRRVGYLLAWQSLDSIAQARRSLLLLLLVTGPVLLLLAGLGGMMLARRALSPVTEITRTAAGISATGLHRRVPIGPAHDELSRLAETFNAMIERLETAVEREHRFTADASHELRSPLSVILAEASLALEEPLDAGAYRTALATIYDQASGMREMVSALLTLAREETLTSLSGSGNGEGVVSLANVVDRAVRQSRATAEERGVTVSTDVPSNLAVAGSDTLLLRAIRNLVDNALRASPVGGTVQILSRRDHDSVTLTVQDEGPGIPVDDLERVFEPFFQVNKARTPGDSHGLGLAICRRIVRAHGGEVTASTPPEGGARLVVTLPAATEIDTTSSSDVHLAHVSS